MMVAPAESRDDAVRRFFRCTTAPAAYPAATVLATLLGALAARHQTGLWSLPHVLVCLLTAASIHVGVLSVAGGRSRAVAALCLAAGAAAGLWLTLNCDPAAAGFTAAGIAGGMLLGVGRHRDSLFSDALRALLFGPIPVVGAARILTGRWVLDAVLTSLVAALLTLAAILPDRIGSVTGGEATDKGNWAARLGVETAVKVYAVLLFLWIVPIGVGLWFRQVSPWLMLPMLPALATKPLLVRMTEDYEDPDALAWVGAATRALYAVVLLLLCLTFVTGGANQTTR
jgi:1,4-dihydroxy-2-naphthoate octaprenyltransferase